VVVTKQRILAIASGGGHWSQLQRIRPAFDGHDLLYVTTLAGLDHTVPNEKVKLVRDVSRTNRLAALVLFTQLFGIILQFRPHVVITTGAAPGVLALWLAKAAGARTIWIDSVANVEDLSMSGRMAKFCSDMWLTQWPHIVSRYPGLSFKGSVL